MTEAFEYFAELDLKQVRYIERTYSQTDTRANLVSVTSKDEWREKAKCFGMTKLFFQPESERPNAKDLREKAAKNICETCSVVAQCLDFGNANKEHGIWGGLTEVERQVKPFASINTRFFPKNT